MLNRDARQFGKQFMFDGSEETCWNSDQVFSHTSVCVHTLAKHVLHRYVPQNMLYVSNVVVGV